MVRGNNKTIYRNITSIARTVQAETKPVYNRVHTIPPLFSRQSPSYLALTTLLASFIFACIDLNCVLTLSTTVEFLIRCESARYYKERPVHPSTATNVIHMRDIGNKSDNLKRTCLGDTVLPGKIYLTEIGDLRSLSRTWVLLCCEVLE